jgi:hypothetical protein
MALVLGIYSFTATSRPDYTNIDGAYPAAGLILSGKPIALSNARKRSVVFQTRICFLKFQE